VATFMFYKGNLLQVVRYGQPGGRGRFIASKWVDGKPNRRVEVYSGSDHYTIRGTATRKGN